MDFFENTSPVVLFLLFGGITLVIIVIIKVVAGSVEREKVATMPPAERRRYLEVKAESELAQQHGPINPAMVCPHCQEKGKIRTKLVDRKKGISGTKATGAILTGGVSMLATGLSRKERLTQAHCGNCKNSWEF